MGYASRLSASAILGLGATASALGATAEPACQLTALQTAAGYVTMANVIMFACAVLGSLFVGMFLFHARKLFTLLPLWAYKTVAYVGIVALCAAGLWAAPSSAPFLEFVGAALGAGALMLILGDIADAMHVEKKDATVWEILVAVLGCSLALLQNNPMVAGVGVAGLMALMGFSAFSMPGMVGMGFDGKGSLWRGTFGALAILVPATIYRVGYGDLGRLEIFWPAIAWLCTLVAGIGLLIASSRFFGRDGAGLYMLRNAGMIAFALFCVWAGSVHGLSELQRVGGTLLIVWLFEKPWDIPKAGVMGYSFLGALSCGAVYMLMHEVAANPDRWGKFLLF